jgi:hypothetical protein
VLPPAAGVEVRRLLDKRYPLSRRLFGAYLRLHRSAGPPEQSAYLAIDCSGFPWPEPPTRSALRVAARRRQ